MSKPTRRRFISFAGKAAAISGLASFSGTTTYAMADNKAFIHHVYFWLKNPDSQEDKDKLIAGLKKLSKVKTIKEVHIGLPAKTNRDVIETTYSVSWLLFFKNKADQDSYQTDPIHLKFIEECSPLWEKVIVYDSEDI
jgi:hypothetical protein